MNPLTEARRRLELLAVPAEPAVITRATEHARRLFLPPGSSAQLAAQFADAESNLAAFGTMTADVRKAWHRLLSRVSDPAVRARLTDLDARVAVGACSGGEVSAATLAFDDASYLILVDHGLATLTWLAAQLHVLAAAPQWLLDLTTSAAGTEHVPAEPVDAMVAARTLRLATDRLAAGGRPGLTPPLVLDAAEIGAAGALVAEMDVFVLAHELAHIVLGHFDDNRPRLGVVGGSNKIIGKRADEESTADQFAFMLLFHDLLSTGALSAQAVEVRVAAVRLFLTALDMYERSCFFVQPSSHPPSSRRWADLADQFASWLPDLTEQLNATGQLSLAAASIDLMPRAEDAAAAASGLRGRVDTVLWRRDDWERAANLAHVLSASGTDAMCALLGWRHWPPGLDTGRHVSSVIDEATRSGACTNALRMQLRNKGYLTRLAAMTTVLEVLGPTPDGVAQVDRDPFPMWAVAVLLLNGVREEITQT